MRPKSSLDDYHPSWIRPEDDEWEYFYGCHGDYITLTRCATLRNSHHFREAECCEAWEGDRWRSSWKPNFSSYEVARAASIKHSQDAIVEYERLLALRKSQLAAMEATPAEEPKWMKQLRGEEDWTNAE